MDQRPMDGAAPLTAPTPEIALAYLDEIGLVRARREERIDRRRLAWFSLVDAVVLSVYVTIAAFAIGVSQVNSSFIVLVALFLIWIQLATERRESYGSSGSPISRTRSVTVGFAVILIAVVIAGFVAAAAGLQLPVVVRLIPGVVALIVLGIPAVRDIRRSAQLEVDVAHMPLGTGGRLATIGCGVLMAGSVWIIAAANQVLVPFFAMLLIGIYLAWWIAGRISERLPALGVLWAWPQWTAFAIAGAVVVGAIVAQLLGSSASILAYAPLGAGTVLLLFIGSAFLDGRDA